MTMPRAAAFILALATVTMLTGCTLVTTLAEGGQPDETAVPAITGSGDTTFEPTPTAAPTPTSTGGGYDYVEQTDIPLAMGQAITVEGRAGTPVGTFQVDSVTTDFTACTDEEYVPVEPPAQYIEIVMTVTALDALAAEDDSWDYPRQFEMYLADAYSASGRPIYGDLGFDCVGLSGWNDTVQPGETQTSRIYLLLDGAEAPVGVEWDYGHQNFKVPIV